MRLLVTRPEAQADMTAAALRAQGHDVVIAPLLRIDMIPDADLGDGPWGAVVMTSANAARAVASHVRLAELLALPVFTVGQRTAEAARAAGFADVESAGGDVTDLATLVADRVPVQRPLLYVGGPDRAGDLAGVLAEAGYAVRMVVVYRAVAEGWLPEEVVNALRRSEIDGVLHFSRRSAGAFLRAVAAADMTYKALQLQHFCLSAEVAEGLVQAGAGHIHIADQPDEQALLDVVGKR